MKPETRWYKVLREDGLAPVTRFKWSLPTRDAPGDWHEAAGPLVRCKNGLHLTSDPWQVESRGHLNGSRLFLAEFEGETDGPHHGHELVCRRVRLLREIKWREEMSPDARDVEAERERREKLKKHELKSYADAVKLSIEKGDSAAYTLLRYVWRHESKAGGGSWRRTNNSMQQALSLAITAGFRFHPGDFARFAKEFGSSHWIGDGEQCYARAVGAESGDHGGNPSAVKSFEAWKGRKPFLVAPSASPRFGGRKGLPSPVRLFVGRRFDWHDGLKTRVPVKVTSFVDHPKGDKPPYVVACSYKAREPDGYADKIDRTFKITHDDIAAYHKAIREHAKKSREGA